MSEKWYEAYMDSIKIIEDVLYDLYPYMTKEDCNKSAIHILAKLARHDPPITVDY